MVVAACGSRSGLHIPPPAPPKPECVVDSDCPGFGDLCNPVACHADGELDAGPPTEKKPGACVALIKVDCDDNDPCTNDTCDPTTGKCHYTHATLDLDGDGYFAPLPGHRPGDPGSCGDDCDDTNPNAHPGGIEVCDGVDNDCNGIIDDNMTFLPSGQAETRISSDGIAPSGPGGLAWSGQSYAALYTGQVGGNYEFFEQRIAADGSSIPPGETPFVEQAPASFSGPVIWVGDRFGTVWSDNRDGADGYEIFFASLQDNGAKIAPGDVRITFAQGFSVNPAIAWNGTEFLLAWEDAREGIFDIFAQRVALDGTPIGDNVQITTAADNLPKESPSIAAGVRTIGVAWHLGESLQGVIQFQPWSLDLTAPAGPVATLTSGGQSNAQFPTVVWNRDRYVIAWYDQAATPKGIYAATVDETGKIITPRTSITSPGPFSSRDPYLRPLGDRLLLVYADDRDQNSGFEIYTRMILPDLSPVTPETRLTNAPFDSRSPIAAFGPRGDVGILFEDMRLNGAHHTWFTHLLCHTMVP